MKTIRPVIIGSLFVIIGVTAGWVYHLSKRNSWHTADQPGRVGRTATSELVSVTALPSFEQSEGNIDPRSGRLFLSATDLSVPGAVRLEVRRYLQDGQGPAGVFGSRWRMNYESHVVRSGTLVVIDDPLGSVLFTGAPDTRRYKSPLGEELVVESGRTIRYRPDGTQEVFNERGWLEERIDRNGNKILVRYDGAGRISRIEGPNGAYLAFTCDNDGRVIEVNSSSQDKVRYNYRSGEQERNLPTASYEYGAIGELMTLTNPLSGKVDFKYDSKHRVVSRCWASGAEERYEFDDDAHTLRQIDPEGRATVMIWSRDGHHADLTGPRGAKTAIDYDQAGRPVTVIGPTGQIARFTYDPLGRTVSTENSSVGTARFEYDGDAPFISTVTDSTGERQTWQYDEHHNLLHITGSKEHCPKSMYEYYSDGLIKTTRTCGSVSFTTTYNPKGLPATITDETGRRWTFEYDERGRLSRETDALDHVTTRTYDSLGRLASVTTAGGGTSKVEYSTSGQLIKTVEPDGAETRYDYDKRGRIVAIHQPGDRTTRFEFYADGQPKSVTNPAGHTTRFEYDEAG